MLENAEANKEKTEARGVAVEKQAHPSLNQSISTTFSSGAEESPSRDGHVSDSRVFVERELQAAQTLLQLKEQQLCQSHTQVQSMELHIVDLEQTVMELADKVQKLNVWRPSTRVDGLDMVPPRAKANSSPRPEPPSPSKRDDCRTSGKPVLTQRWVVAPKPAGRVVPQMPF